MPRLTIEIGETLAGRTVKSLMERELRMSDTLIKRVKMREGGIMLSGRRAHVNAVVSAGSVLEIDASDGRAASAAPWDMPLRVAYEDGDILIIDKDAGVAVHSSTRAPEEMSIENALAFRCPDAAAHPVSRLDKGTSGLMTVAKSGYVHELVRQSLHTDAFKREYLAVTVGVPPQREGWVELPIGFEPGSRYKRAAVLGGAPSRTQYEVIARGDGLALLRVRPLTGRSHQIRVHMAAIGCPLAGDWLYGKEDAALIARPALHSSRLYLTQPLSGRGIYLYSPLPGDMAALVHSFI